MIYPHKKYYYRLLSTLLVSFTLFSSSFSTYAAGDYAAQMEERKSLPIESNSWEDWPTGPEIGAEAAILMDANSGTILYSKNIHEKLYPASTTKMLTCLLAAENSAMDETVTFSYDAVHSVPSDGSSMGIDAGEALPMSECLYGIMVASANEVATAVGEHVGGSVDNFVQMMNEKAAELGCTDSHFVNCNGLYDDDHYTSPYDLALIAKAFFSNSTLRRIGNTPSYHFLATSTQPDDFYKTNKHKLITGEISYDGIIGGKTGFTDAARETLVTGCEKNGMRLICVIMKEESPYQFTDTVTLFDYGFQNFSTANVANNDSKYMINHSNFFQNENSIFGSTKPLLSINSTDSVILPNMSDFSVLDSSISYDVQGEDEVAKISYFYHSVPIGTARVMLDIAEDQASYDFADTELQDTNPSLIYQQNTIFINVKMIILLVCGAAVILTIITMIFSVFINRKDLKLDIKRKRRMRRDIRQRRREERKMRRARKNSRNHWKKRNK